MRRVALQSHRSCHRAMLHILEPRELKSSMAYQEQKAENGHCWQSEDLMSRKLETRWVGVQVA